MNVEQQLIFLFSALGAINGFLVSGYFLLKRDNKRLSDYFLGGLLLMLSIRVIKSVFLHFNRGLFDWFIQAGLTACILIGPFLFLYVRSLMRPDAPLKKRWWWHVVPYIVLISGFRYVYDYYENKELWGAFIRMIYRQWLVYILIAGYQMRAVFKVLFKKGEALSDEQFWLLNIYLGTTIVWTAYYFSSYTSYIVGALSFTFLGYVSGLLWLYKKSSKKLATDPPLKYAGSSLSEKDVAQYHQKIQQYLETEKAFLDPNLTLVILSQKLGISRKETSQVINQTTGQNYSNHIAQLRIQEAQRLLQLPDYEAYKIATIAYESGFNSLSSFNTHFKRVTGETPQQYRKKWQNHGSDSQKHDLDRK